MPSAVPGVDPQPRFSTTPNRNAIGEIAVLFALITLLAGEPVPGVNESHYLPKGKHLLDSTFCAGDLFFESHASHGLAAGLVGLLSQCFPLYAVAWGGRIISWLCLACAWRQLRFAMDMNWIVGAAALCSWYFAIDYGNWAGEWAVGGFEGKSLAYPCIIVAFSELFRAQWSRVWLWLGLAVAWHPLAGGWAGLSFGCVWLLLPNLLSRARSQAIWLAAGTGLGLVGVIPAAIGLNSPNQVSGLVASQIHVFYRLAHHQCPSLFAADRHFAGAISLALLIVLTGAFVLSSRSIVNRRFWQNHPIAWLLTIAWISVLFSLVGLGIDKALSRSNPILASQLLRFYWFRWSDIMVPLAWTLTFWKMADPGGLFRMLPFGDDSPLGESAAASARPSVSHSKSLQSRRGSLNDPSRPRPAKTAITMQILGGCVLLMLLSRHAQSNFERRNPAADDILLKAPATRLIETDRYVDWLAVCDWIAKNSPADSLWFTPEHQQTFKWYAGRAEVVCWKDVPQDNASVRKWYERLVACRPPRSPSGDRMEWTSKQLLTLARRYGFRWVLVDRSLQEKPLLDFEIMYPINSQNKSFAVFRIPEYLLDDSHKEASDK